MNSWKSGDEALIEARKNHDKARVNGKACTLILFLGNATSINGNQIDDCWRVYVHGFGVAYVSEPCLRKPYDGHQPGSWEAIENIWNPAREFV